MTSDGSMKKVTPILSDKGRSFCPNVKIIEQPASKAVRFRYECEGRSAGSIPGVNSTPENKTYPTIKVFGYHGRAVAVVSCVTKDPPHKPHPHSLIGKDTCEGGVYRTEISPESMTVTFPGLGIQCVKKKNIEEALKIREKIRVDPFNTGFEHKRQPINIDLNVVRLCFQVFIEGSVKGKFTVPLMPVVSNPIYDKKAVSDLTICKLSHHSASVGGGMEMVLLCEKIVKEDIQVRFFEERDGQVVWEGFGDFQPSQVHKQVAITFKTPPYHNQHIERAAWIYIQLMRPSDSTTSVALPFKMTPLDTDNPELIKRKREQFNDNLRSQNIQHIPMEVGRFEYSNARRLNPASTIKNSLNLVKLEPMDTVSHDGNVAASTRSLYPETNVFSSLPGSNWSMQTSQQQNLMFQYEMPLDTTQQQFKLQKVTHGNEHMNFNQMEPEPTEDLKMHQPIINADNANNTLDLDDNLLNFDMNQLGSFTPINSAELATLGIALSENFSDDLSISDVIKTQSAKNLLSDSVRNTGESTSMSDSFTRLTNTTIQELRFLNNIYKPMENGE